MGRTQSAVCISSPSSSSVAAEKNNGGKSICDSGGPRLAKKILVPRNSKSGHGLTFPSTAGSRPAEAGHATSFKCSVIGFEGLAVETEILKELVLGQSVILTRIKVRKCKSSKVYYKT